MRLQELLILFKVVVVITESKASLAKISEGQMDRVSDILQQLDLLQHQQTELDERLYLLEAGHVSMESKVTTTTAQLEVVKQQLAAAVHTTAAVKSDTEEILRWLSNAKMGTRFIIWGGSIMIKVSQVAMAALVLFAAYLTWKNGKLPSSLPF